MKKTNEELELEEEEYNEDEEMEEMEEESETTSSKKESKPKTNCSPVFVQTIKDYLDSYAQQDSVFAERYANPDKNIEECCNYIIHTVQKSGCHGFADEEVYKMARDYYVDDVDKKDLTPVGGNVVVNHQVELTEEEKAKAREEAIKKYQDEEYKALKKKAKAEEEKSKKAIEKAKEEKQKKIETKGYDQLSLF